LAAAFALSIFFSWQILHLELPPNGLHKWREFDTATVAENFYRETMNILTPRVNQRGMSDGVVGSEFPIYNYVVALFYRILGFSHVWPRTISALGALFYLFCLRRVAYRFFSNDRRAANIALLLAGSSPLLMFYGGKIMPDVWGLALSTFGFDRFTEYMASRRFRPAAFATIGFMLAGLIKPHFLLVGLPLLVLIVQQDGVAGLQRPAYWIMALVTLAAVGTWFAYANWLNQMSGSSYFYLGGNWIRELSGLLKPKFYQHLFLTWTLELLLPIATAPLFLWGIWRLRANPLRYLIGSWWLGMLIIAVLAAEHFATPHEYYLLPALTPTVLLVTGVANRLLGHPQAWMRAAIGGVLVALPLMAVARIDRRYESGLDVMSLRQEVAKIIPANELILSVDSMPGKNFYLADRKGWSYLPDQQQILRRDYHQLRDVRWLVRDPKIPIPPLLVHRLGETRLLVPELEIITLQPEPLYVPVR
jgi:4-amino-4-deoxy-L-arabinose transferase-like glycosyltransferase